MQNVDWFRYDVCMSILVIRCGGEMFRFWWLYVECGHDTIHSRVGSIFNVRRDFYPRDAIYFVTNIPIKVW